MSKDWAFVSPRLHHTTSAGGLGYELPTAQASVAYDAGQTTGRRLKNWRPSYAGPNSVMAHSAQLIRARSRNAVRNDPWGGAAQDRSMFNGIGTGIMAMMVNGTREQKTFINELWIDFMEQCDADGCLTGEGQQGLAWYEWQEAGEIFARLRTRRLTDPMTVPLQVQLLEAEMLDNTLFTTASNGNEVKYGIEFNKIGQRVAYWFWRDHPGDYSSSTRFSGERTRVPASSVIHLFRPTRAGQTRGLPDAVSALVRMYNLDNMDDAVLERTKIANLFAGFYKQNVGEGDNPEGMIDEMTDGEAEKDDDEIPLAGLEPGTMQELPPGYEAQFTPAQTPDSNYAEYQRTHLLAVAARYGVPYEVLTGDLRDVGDRALKLILNEFRRGIETKQWQWFVPMYCQPIRVAFLDSAYLAGLLDDVIPDYAERRRFYQRTLWVPQGWPYSHPVQDVDADRKAIRSGLASPISKILATGEDPEQVIAEYVAFNEQADEAGLIFDSDPRKTDGSGKAQGSVPDDDEDPDDPSSNEPPIDDDEPTDDEPTDDTTGDDTDG